MNKGIKTSEFWTGLLAVILIYLNEALGLKIPVEAIVTIGGIVLAYILSRTAYKVAGMKMGYGKKK